MPTNMSRPIPRSAVLALPVAFLLLEPGYRALLQQGADLIETDLSAQLGALLFGSPRVPLSRERFFRVP